MDSQTKVESASGKEQEDTDDEFFGNQDEGGDYGGLGQHESTARGQELRAIGYFESYDETKETLLQEGFEAGYREIYDAALRLGVLFGKLSAETHLSDGRNESLPDSKSSQYSEAAGCLRDFLTDFQNRPYDAVFNAKETIEFLECELARSDEKG